MELIRVSDVQKTYKTGTVALYDFNLSIKRNITRIKKKLKKNRAIFINYEIDEDILEEELSEILEI